MKLKVFLIAETYNYDIVYYVVEYVCSPNYD